jgi:hypothetical protein
MSIEAIDQVLHRWFLDPAFRDALADDPQATLESYDLDKKERARLSKMKGGRRPKTRRSKGAIAQAERLAL